MVRGVACAGLCGAHRAVGGGTTFDTQAMVSNGTHALGFDHINLDDCWHGAGSPLLSSHIAQRQPASQRPPRVTRLTSPPQPSAVVLAPLPDTLTTHLPPCSPSHCPPTRTAFACRADTTRAPDGSLRPDPARFPSGTKAVAARLHAMGLKFWLYTSMGDTTCNSGGRSSKVGWCGGGERPGGGRVGRRAGGRAGGWLGGWEVGRLGDRAWAQAGGWRMDRGWRREGGERGGVAAGRSAGRRDGCLRTRLWNGRSWPPGRRRREVTRWFRSHAADQLHSPLHCDDVAADPRQLRSLFKRCQDHRIVRPHSPFAHTTQRCLAPARCGSISV